MPVPDMSVMPARDPARELATSRPSPLPLGAAAIAAFILALGPAAPTTAVAQGSPEGQERRPAAASSGDGQEEAERSEAFKKHVAEAREAYAAKNYERALEFFKKAYAINDTPNLLFNMGLVNEKMGRLDQSLEYYEKFVTSPEVGLKLRAKAQKRIDVIRPIVEDQEKKKAKKGPDTTGDGTEGNGDGAKKADDSDTVAPPPSTGNDGKGRKAASFALLGTGVASLAAGGVFVALSNQAETDFQSAPTAAARRQEQQAAYTRMWIADGFLLGGIALVGTGTVLLLTGPSGAETEADAGATEKPAAALVPSVGPRGAGFSFSASF